MAGRFTVKVKDLFSVNPFRVRSAAGPAKSKAKSARSAKDIRNIKAPSVIPVLAQALWTRRSFYMMSENDFLSQIIDLCHLKGWAVAHFRSVPVRRKDGSFYYQTPVQADGSGFPDLVLVRDYVIFAELKTDKGQVTEAQAQWLNILSKAGCDVYIWRPSMWDEIVRILGD